MTKTSCNKFREGICEIVGVEPRYIECANALHCNNVMNYEQCRLYTAEYLIGHKLSVEPPFKWRAA
jgi:hypothetical protein